MKLFPFTSRFDTGLYLIGLRVVDVNGVGRSEQVACLCRVEMTVVTLAGRGAPSPYPTSSP